MSGSNSVPYQNHVACLRGIAILLIVVFHIIPKLCPCGHFGVDIFFVISGYFLYNSLGRLSGDAKSLGNFYIKKSTRIFPPLILLILVLCPICFFCTVIDYRISFGEGAAAALLGLSNRYLQANTAGYFRALDLENAFTHTWYLAVTLQVYLLLPIAHTIFNKFGPRLQKALWGSLALGSLLVYYVNPETLAHCPHPVRFAIESTGLTSVFPIDTLPYYWTSARIWEVLLGTYLASLPKPTMQRKCPALLGIFLILLPPFIFSASSMFNIPTILGTMLLIRYGTAIGNKLLLANPILLFLGTISYSLYLWHFPIKILWKGALELELDSVAYILIFAISICVSWISWRYTEKRKFRFRHVVMAWILAFALTCAFATGKANANLFGSSMQFSTELYRSTRICTDESLQEDLPKSMIPMPDFYGGGIYKNFPWDNHQEAQLLTIGDSSKPYSFVFTGDSHANALFPAFDALGKELGIHGVYLRSYQTPVPGYHWLPGRGVMHVTPQKTEDLINWVGAHKEFKYVILGQWWEARLKALAKTLDGEDMTEKMQEASELFYAALEDLCIRIRQQGKMVVFVRQTPILTKLKEFPLSPYVNSLILHHQQIPVDDLTVYEEDFAKYASTTGKMFEKLEGKGLCLIIDPTRFLFKDGKFCAFEDCEMNMRDNHHLTFKGAMKALPSVRIDLEPLFINDPGHDQKHEEDSNND